MQVLAKHPEEVNEAPELRSHELTGIMTESLGHWVKIFSATFGGFGYIWTIYIYIYTERGNKDIEKSW